MSALVIYGIGVLVIGGLLAFGAGRDPASLGKGDQSFVAFVLTLLVVLWPFFLLLVVCAIPFVAAYRLGCWMRRAR